MKKTCTVYPRFKLTGAATGLIKLYG